MKVRMQALQDWSTFWDLGEVGTLFISGFAAVFSEDDGVVLIANGREVEVVIPDEPRPPSLMIRGLTNPQDWYTRR